MDPYACLEVDQITAPACWASALVNGDFSGLDDDDEAACKAWMDDLAADGWSVVDVARDDDGEGVEPRFSWSYGACGGTAKGGDVVDYVIHKNS